MDFFFALFTRVFRLQTHLFFFLFGLCRLRVLPENGLLFLSLIKSTHLVKAYKKTQEIAVNYSSQLAITICKSEEKIPCHEICALSPSTIRDTAVDCVSQ